MSELDRPPSDGEPEVQLASIHRDNTKVDEPATQSALEASPPNSTSTRPPVDVDDADGALAKLSGCAIVAIILSAIAILVTVTALVLTVDVQPGQGTVLGGAAVLVGGGLTYLGSHQKRRSDERIEIRKYEQTAKQIELAQDEATRARLEFEKTLQTQIETQNAAAAREQNRELRARFATATELLSSGAFAARLTGIHELAALADDWAAFDRPAERQVCIDILCAQLRTPRQLATEGRTEDDQFRTAIVRVIKGRTAMDPNTGDGPWQTCNFDLSDAELPPIDLQNCRFNGELNFMRTIFDGSVKFGYSHLANARFDNAAFSPGTSFRSASFGHRVSFEGVAFSGNVSFRLATFRGHTSFSHAIVQNAKLDFTNARFDLGSQTVLRFMTLQGATVLDFTAAWFRGGEVDLRNTEFDSDCRFRFTRPQALTSLPRTDWEEAVPGDLPSQLQPREWPPTKFVHSASQVADASQGDKQAPLDDD
ncbi:pentapeptide repeat-containing protein [Rhodococcus fascians]|uniref:pentapeptide repeat-containing protein n=1 Tax=Rhodococcoides fascians TaxID=1828 RepID=UPI0024B72449|nr:pentapeptide repeat-containing protein [Rhodococcus fascians]MDJ0004859.1 pentapeptide repeat-containing protein [Rhodococcus fascians]